MQLPVASDVVPDGQLLTIAEAAAATGLRTHTLRWYEAQDLLLEPAERTAAGHRRFDPPAMRWLEGLLMLRATGMPIAQMREYARACRPQTLDPARRLALLEQHQQRVSDQLADTARHLAAITAKADWYRQQLATPEEKP